MRVWLEEEYFAGIYNPDIRCSKLGRRTSTENSINERMKHRRDRHRGNKRKDLKQLRFLMVQNKMLSLF